VPQSISSPNHNPTLPPNKTPTDKNNNNHLNLRVIQLSPITNHPRRPPIPRLTIPHARPTPKPIQIIALAHLAHTALLRKHLDLAPVRQRAIGAKSQRPGGVPVDGQQVRVLAVALEGGELRWLEGGEFQAVGDGREARFRSALLVVVGAVGAAVGVEVYDWGGAEGCADCWVGAGEEVVGRCGVFAFDFGWGCGKGCWEGAC
jgi:hypothetical protein